VRKNCRFPFDQFEDGWDAKTNWLERQIEALKDQENHLEGWRKELVRAEIKRLERL
jgi:hypothetical protein